MGEEGEGKGGGGGGGVGKQKNGKKTQYQRKIFRLTFETMF